MTQKSFYFPSAERSRKSAELEVAECRENIQDLSYANTNLGADKRHMEGVLRGQQQELESLMLSVKNSEEKCKKAVSDASRLAEELRTEQEHSGAVERGAKVDNIACLHSRNFIMGGERHRIV